MSNRSLMFGRIGSPVSWSSSSSSSSTSILKRRDGGVFSSLLLLMSMSLNGEPGSVRVDSSESGDSLLLLAVTVARVLSAVNMLLVGWECKRQVDWTVDVRSELIIWDVQTWALLYLESASMHWCTLLRVQVHVNCLCLPNCSQMKDNLSI